MFYSTMMYLVDCDGSCLLHWAVSVGHLCGWVRDCQLLLVLRVKQNYFTAASVPLRSSIRFTYTYRKQYIFKYNSAVLVGTVVVLNIRLEVVLF